jgi:hypothetical protein
MSNELTKKLDELKSIQAELGGAGLSRRRFMDRLKAIGLGFGVTTVMGVKASDALAAVEPGVSVKSTNSAVDNVMTEGQDLSAVDPNAPAGPDGQPIETAQLVIRRRRYARIGLPYARILPYSRLYSRYSRLYTRLYRRF